VGKLLFWIIIVLVGLTVARIVARSAASRPADGARPQAQSRRGAAPKTQPAEQMVRCAHCGIHLPRSEALLLGGHTWCSQDHARLGVNKN
jgi:uncharacterized protein